MTDLTQFMDGPLHCGFTGTQRGMTDKQLSVVKDILVNTKPIFHHGDCIGADKQAHDIAEALKLSIILHPPIIEIKRAFCVADECRIPKPYIDRNHDIVNESNHMIATPGEYVEQLRSGTWATIRFGKKCGKTVYIIMPDGTIEIV